MLFIIILMVPKMFLCIEIILWLPLFNKLQEVCTAMLSMTLFFVGHQQKPGQIRAKIVLQLDSVIQQVRKILFFPLILIF